MKRRPFIKSASLATGAVALSPHLIYNKIYGMDQFAKDCQPFEIKFLQEDIKDLNRRIDLTRWFDGPYETGWNAGVNINVLKELVIYWRNEFDWFTIQNQLNQLAHFTCPIEGERLHCIRYNATGKKHGFPLLLVHGWPSSFMEFEKAAPLLANGVNGKKGFDIVVPSLPGFVFSEAPKQPGMHCAKIGERFHLLMKKLGYQRYGIHGGDWGSVIVRDMARQQPHSVVGMHSTSIGGPPPPEGTSVSEEESKYRKWRKDFDVFETGYSHLQGTKPQSLAVGLSDSPVGLLAWMLEKYWAWSDHGEDIWDTFDRDWVLTNATLYWLTNSVLSASRIYYEHYHTYSNEAPKGKVEIPVGYAHFPREPWAAPKEVAERNNNIVHYTKMPGGGHFAAIEKPELLAGDIRAFFEKL